MASKRGVWCLLIAALLILPASLALSGIGITPSCYESQGSTCETVNLTAARVFEFRVYNYDSAPKTFSMASSDERIQIVPSVFTLSENNRQGCESNPGCQIVSVGIDPSLFEEGTYSATISAQTSESSGAVNLNQVIGSRISFMVPGKPPIAQVRNHVFTVDTLYVGLWLFLILLILLLLLVIILYLKRDDRERTVVETPKIVKKRKPRRKPKIKVKKKKKKEAPQDNEVEVE